MQVSIKWVLVSHATNVTTDNRNSNHTTKSYILKIKKDTGKQNFSSNKHLLACISTPFLDSNYKKKKKKLHFLKLRSTVEQRIN